MRIELHTPIADEDIRKLKVGDSVYLSGIVVTGRDAAHKWLADNFIHHSVVPTAEDQAIFDALKPFLDGGLIYHCGTRLWQDWTRKSTVLWRQVRPRASVKNLTRPT